MSIANQELLFYIPLLVLNCVVVFIAVKKVLEAKAPRDKTYVFQLLAAMFVTGQLALNAALMISHLSRNIQ